MGLAFTSKGKSLPQSSANRKDSGGPEDAPLQVGKNPAAMRPFESLHNAKYRDDKLVKPITGLALKDNAGYKFLE